MRAGLLGFAVMVAIGLLLASWADHGRPTGPSCVERFQHIRNFGERYDGELENVSKDCRPDPQWGR
jgi:hypothetical protein